MKTRQEMEELHGEDFADNFDSEFEISPEDIPVPFTYKLRQFLSNKYVWYVAGLIDAVVILLIVSLILK